MIISHSKNFIYVHLEKTGGTSIVSSLRNHLSPTDLVIKLVPGGTNQEKQEQLNFIKKYNTTLIQHSPAKDIKEFMGDKWESMYKFATVRDPYDLMISHYFYAQTVLSNFMDINHKNIIDFFNIENNQSVLSWTVSFPYMLDYCDAYLNETYIDGFIKSIMSKKSHHQMKTQTERLEDSVEVFDLSNINNDWQTIVSKTKTYGAILKYENKSHKKEVALSDETIQSILDFFKEDYETIPNRTGINWKHSLI